MFIIIVFSPRKRLFIIGGQWMDYSLIGVDYLVIDPLVQGVTTPRAVWTFFLCPLTSLNTRAPLLTLFFCFFILFHSCCNP